MSAGQSKKEEVEKRIGQIRDTLVGAQVFRSERHSDREWKRYDLEEQWYSGHCIRLIGHVVIYESVDSMHSMV